VGVHRDGEDLLGVVLSDDVLIEVRDDRARRQPRLKQRRRCSVRHARSA
jgi:hypothetical protein